MRLIVAKRRTVQKFFQNECEKNIFIKEKNYQKYSKRIASQIHNYGSNLILDSNDLLNMKSDEWEKYYNFEIIVDESRTPDTINLPIRFQMPVAPLFTGSSFVSKIQSMTISLEQRDLNGILNVFNS